MSDTNHVLIYRIDYVTQTNNTYHLNRNENELAGAIINLIKNNMAVLEVTCLNRELLNWNKDKM